ncbi:hypothetical protein ACP275_10G105600 [Erythranthe tilingii]
MAPAKYRGAFNNGFQLSVGIGALAANLINYGTEKIDGGFGWRISLAMAAVPASALILGALFLPETPNSLIQLNNNHEKAKKTGKIAGRNYRPQFVMSIAIPFFQQVTGINVIAFYAPIVFRTIGFWESASLLSAVMTGVVGIATTFASMVIVDRFGRRFLLIIGGIVMFASQMIVGSVMAAELDDRGGGLSKGYADLVLVLIGVYVAGFGVSWGPLGCERFR